MTASTYHAMNLLQTLEAPNPGALQSALDRTAALSPVDALTAAEDERRELLQTVVGQIRKNCLPYRPLRVREREQLDTCVALLRHLTTA